MKHYLVDLYQVCLNYASGAKNDPALGGLMLYIDLYRQKNEKIFLSETIMPRALIYVASLCGPLPNLFKLYPWGQKWHRPGGHMLDIGLYREKHGRIFLSETTWPRAFGMKHFLVVFYPVRSNFTPGAKNGPTPGVTCFT